MNYALFERLCGEKGTNPTALARKLGLSKGNTSNWKNGGNPSVDILCKLADELDCTADSLLGREENHVTSSWSLVSIPELSEVEEMLVSDFRSLTDQGRDYIKQQMFIAKEVYKKEDFSATNLNAG